MRGGNAPAAYGYNPNTVQLDQAVLYIERLPDTVQKDHVDWGFRLAPIYGENYRYTTAYGLLSYQLLNQNKNNGYDMPMAYGEVFIPQVMEGLMVRFGRYISIPDIEAQLAPNNYMYSHSMTYTFDNYTNTGIEATLAATKNWIFQAGVHGRHRGDALACRCRGSPIRSRTRFIPDTPCRKIRARCRASPLGVRWTSDSGNDDINLVANGINGGQWGYNNLQWYGGTYYHKFNDQWHISIEIYNEHQNNVLNALNPAGAGRVSPPAARRSRRNTCRSTRRSCAQCCKQPTVLSCTAECQTALMYLNYKPIAAGQHLLPRRNIVDDKEGQRTGTKTRYIETGIGWQHWFSPQIEIRPEVSYLQVAGCDSHSTAMRTCGIAPNKKYAIIGSADIIIHF